MSSDVDDFVAAQTSDLALGRSSNSDGNRPRSIANFDAVKVETLTLLAEQITVTPMVVKRFDEPGDHFYGASEPWRRIETISSAVSAASRPLLVKSGIERSSA
jgi:hypothetical protein